MATPVELPKSGNTVEECLIGRWLKRAGDRVSAGDIVAEVETDKATFEIVAPVGGTVLATFFDEGALVPVFTTVCVIGAPGEAVEGFRPRLAGIRDSGLGIRAQSPAPSSQFPVRSPQVPSPPVPSGALSPRARKFARARAYSPGAMIGTGPNGRVLERDVREAYELARPATPAPPQTPRPSGTRAIIARRLRESLASTAQYTLHGSANASALLALRAQIKSRRPEVTINALVAFCAVGALRETPGLNAEFIDGAIVTHAAVHLGFACDTPRGLLVPVIRDAHALSLGVLARRMNDLATQAADGRISPDDLSGATFTISNLGSLGVESFTPVLNAPQVAILGVGAIQLKPLRVKERVEFIDAIALSLTCDHQVIDGAPGARFLQVVREKIEQIEEHLFLRS